MRIHPLTNKDVKYPPPTLYKKIKRFIVGLSSRNQSADNISSETPNTVDEIEPKTTITMLTNNFKVRYNL